MEKKNPTRMDTSETEKGNAIKNKKGSKKAREKGERKTLETLEQKTSSERTNRSPGGPKKEQEKSFQREKRGFKILGKEKPKKRNRVKKDTFISKTPH